MDEAARQNTTKAIATLTSTLVQSWCTSVPNAASGAAATKTFFTHCRGRIALTTPTIRLAGGPVTGTSSLMSSLIRPLLPPAVRPGHDARDGCAEGHAGGHVAGIVHADKHSRER